MRKTKPKPKPKCDHSLSACSTYKENYDDLVYVCRTCNKKVA